MIRLNLKKGQPIFYLHSIRLLIAGLLLCGIFLQSYFNFQKNAEYKRKQNEIESLKKQIYALQTQKKELTENTETFDALNGAIIARNTWLNHREKSPVYLLAKLEQEKPIGVELKTFESDRIKGTIKMVSADLDTASRFMNSILGNNVRVTLDERINNGIIAICTWNE